MTNMISREIEAKMDMLRNHFRLIKDMFGGIPLLTPSYSPERILVLTGRNTMVADSMALLTLVTGTFPIFITIYHGYLKIVGTQTFGTDLRNPDTKQHNSCR